ncbi:hypothetical protein [Actinomadura welshii]|uniref:hypothetical protein n=1 Tax=Actinomadura welshii TaxID=3103817 RepID=UPI001267B535|nr:hypothetical protein [Actinomadura madurae]
MFTRPPPNRLVSDRRQPVAALPAEQTTIVSGAEPVDVRAKDGSQLRAGRNRPLHALSASLEASRLMVLAVIRPLLAGSRARTGQQQTTPAN